MQLHKYQEYCAQRIETDEAVGLFLDMGLGKTAATLTGVARLLDRCEIRRVLVVAPKTVAMTVWDAEARKWPHLRWLSVSVVAGLDGKRRLSALARSADVYVINRDLVPWLVSLYKDDYSKWPFDALVIDELSSFKNASVKRFRALRKILPYTKRRIGLTGTPAPNGLLGLWAEIFLLDRGERLGKRFTEFRDLYFTPGKRNGYVVYSWNLRPYADDQIMGAIGDLCVSMRAEDWLELPERIDNVIYSSLAVEAVPVYRNMAVDLISMLNQKGQDGTVIAAGNAAAALGKLLQICNGALYDETGLWHQVHSGKLDQLAEIVEAADGQPVLVFYSFRHDIPRIKEALPPGVEILDQAEQVERWNKGEIPVLLAHPASAGHGLNLQAGGHIIVWFGLPWSLELYQQANARLHRQGQTRPVIIHHLLTKGTVEETVLAALQSKGATQDKVLAAVKAQLEKE